jgi:8-oxo-dGTP pyrophosphatase MutT (NUDIX family)
MSLKVNGPWKIKKSIEKYKNPWIKVIEDQVIRPDGKDGIHSVIEMVNGVSVLPLDNEGFVYITKQFRYSLGKESIEVVSGAIDKNEKPLQTAKRELEEELGIVANEWTNLGLVNPFTSIVKSSATLFLARKLSFKESNQDGTENIDLIKIKFEDALNMVMKSEITHGQSCILILKAAKYLQKI